MSSTERIAWKCAKSSIKTSYGLTEEHVKRMAKSNWRKRGDKGVQDQDDGLDGRGLHFIQVLGKNILFVLPNLR